MSKLVNIEEIDKLITEYDESQEMPFILEGLTRPTMDALGDNESDVIDFINEANKKQLVFLSMFIEEILDRFPSDEMDKAVDILVSAME